MDSTIDVDALVAPISEESPCGNDPRSDTSFASAYNRLKDAREAAMAVERPDKSALPGESQAPLSIDRAKWKEVVDLAQEILLEIAKDIEVCALLVEGLARTDGPAGIRDGFILTSHLVKNYWEDLFPRLDPEDPESIEDRIAAFTGLNGIGQPGTLAVYIAKIPITNSGSTENFRPYDYDRAWSANSIPDPDEREARFASIGFSLEDVENAAKHSSTEFYVELDESVRECQTALQELDQAFTTACGHSAPPTGLILESIEKLASTIAYLAKDKLAKRAESVPGIAADIGNTPSSTGTTTQSHQATGAIRSREDAISQLGLVASYFRETEPHSPISYSLQNLIRWSQLPLDKLINEWIQDRDARERYLLMTGMRAQGTQETRESDESNVDD